MIYLITKIIAYLLSALAIGFGMGWFVQYSQAKRLREQLNNVVFETKSRIPQLETVITKRDQQIEQLNMQLKESSPASSDDRQSTNDSTDQNATSFTDQSEQEKELEAELQQLRRTVAELTTELEIAHSMAESSDEPVREVDFTSDRNSFNGTNDEDSDDFLDEIKDIFDGDDREPRSRASSLSDFAAAENMRAAEEASHAAGYAAGLAAAQSAAHASAATPSSGGSSSSPNSEELEQLRIECEELNAARRKLAETIDSQTRELEQVKEQTNLQDKSLNVLNQQLELSREANERIVRELKKYKAGAS